MNHLGDIAQLITAIALAYNCWQTWHNGQKANGIKEDIKRIEVQTNGINAALVASTAKASLAEGKAEGLEQGRKESNP